jgi:hypothetical protein
MVASCSSETSADASSIAPESGIQLVAAARVLEPMDVWSISLLQRCEAVREAKVFLAGRPEGPLTRRVTTSCGGEP